MKKGMTIIELTIVIVLLSIVMLFVTNFMIFQHKNISKQKTKIDTIQRADKVNNYLLSNLRMVGYCSDPKISGFGIIHNIGTVVTDSTAIAYTADLNDNKMLDPTDTIAFSFSGDTLYKYVNGAPEPLATGIDFFKIRYFISDGTSTTAPTSLQYGSIIGVNFDLSVSQRLSGSKYFTKDYHTIVDFRNN